VETSDVIAIIAAVIAVAAIVPGVLGWLEAKKQTTAARTAAKGARDDAEIAKEQAEAAQQQAVAAQEQARAANRAAGAAEGAKAAAAGGLLFEIDRALAAFDDVHTALRPGGPGWVAKDRRPSRDEWVRVERYMGTFERIHALVEAGLLDIALVEELYGYRIANLVADEHVYRDKLVENAAGWRRFIELWADLDAASRHRTTRPLSHRSPAQREEDEASL
jgi:hypothetical protein